MISPHKIFRTSLLALFVAFGALHASASDNRNQNASAQFKLVEDAVTSRWLIFQDDQEFSLFRSDKSDALLKEEFENLHQKRQQLVFYLQIPFLLRFEAAFFEKIPSFRNFASYLNRL